MNKKEEDYPAEFLSLMRKGKAKFTFISDVPKENWWVDKKTPTYIPFTFGDLHVYNLPYSPNKLSLK